MSLAATVRLCLLMRRTGRLLIHWLLTHGPLVLQVVFNKDSSRVGPREWVQIAKILDKYRCAGQQA